MIDARKPLANHVDVALDESRLARQRAAILSRLEPRRRRWVFLLAPALCVVLTLVLYLRARPDHASETVAGAMIEAPIAEALPITLLDGSRVVLDPGSKVSLVTLLPNEVRIRLERGRIALDVTHVDGRAFTVNAAGYDVRVVGTSFSVAVLPEGAVEVHVARGKVRVTRSGEPSEIRLLGAGETWSAALATQMMPSAETMPSPEPASPESASPEPAVPEPVASAPEPVAEAASTPANVVPRPPTAQELWTQAESARAAKRFRDEAAALNVLRLRHRSDPRAGIAAFELGRLRQDTLHDPAGAADAFADAIALAPKGPFREDAEARRVEALDGARRLSQCVEARAAFLARFPNSVHRQRVMGRCEAR